MAGWPQGWRTDEMETLGGWPGHRTDEQCRLYGPENGQTGGGRDEGRISLVGAGEGRTTLETEQKADDKVRITLAAKQKADDEGRSSLEVEQDAEVQRRLPGTRALDRPTGKAENQAYWRLENRTAGSQPDGMTSHCHCRQSIDGPGGLTVCQQGLLTEDQEQVSARLLTGDQELT